MYGPKPLFHSPGSDANCGTITPTLNTHIHITMNQFGPPSPTKEEHKIDPTAIVMKPKKAKLHFNKDGTYRPPPKVPFRALY